MLKKKESNVTANTEPVSAGAAGPAADTSSAEVQKVKKPKNPKNKKLIKKAVIIVVVVAVVVAAATMLLGGKDKGETGIPVQVGTAEKMDLSEEVPIRGNIKGSDSADITSTLNYEITQILVKEGDRVTKGQLLATLDGGDLADQYKKAQLALSQSKQDYETSKKLYEEGAIAKSELDKAKAAYDADSLTVSSFDGLSNTKITSPIDGTVTRVNVTLGTTAKDTVDNKPMFVVEDLDNLQMKVKISEYDISKIKVGQEVTITAQVLGDSSVTGTVSHIAPSGEQKDASSKEMVIPVTIDVNKGDTNLIAGVTAKATILIEKKSDILAVPIDAIQEDPNTGESAVFAVRDGVVKKIPVTVGLQGAFNVEVTASDLNPGDQVVLSPDFSLTDGAAVTVGGAGK